MDGSRFYSLPEPGTGLVRNSKIVHPRSILLCRSGRSGSGHGGGCGPEEPQNSSTGDPKHWIGGAGRQARRGQSIQIEGPAGRSLVGIFLRPLQGFAELFLQEPVAVFHPRQLPVEHIGGPGLVVVQSLEQCIEVLATGQRLLGGAVGQDLSGRRIDDQIGIALRATDGQLPGLAHSPIVPDLC